MPKRCGHMEGKQVLPKEEMVAKVRAAVQARKGEMVIIARTDARAVIGFDDAIDRAQAYAEAGQMLSSLKLPISRGNENSGCHHQETLLPTW